MSDLGSRRHRRLRGYGSPVRSVGPLRQGRVGPVRTLARHAVNSSHELIIANFDRTPMPQEGGTHFSPIAAYDPHTDRFLVMDVARFHYPPWWATTEMLFKGMNTFDMTAGKNVAILLFRANPRHYRGLGRLFPRERYGRPWFRLTSHCCPWRPSRATLFWPPSGSPCSSPVPMVSPSPAEVGGAGSPEMASRTCSSSKGALLVALIWHDGFRDLYFYAPPGGQDQQVWVTRLAADSATTSKPPSVPTRSLAVLPQRLCPSRGAAGAVESPGHRHDAGKRRRPGDVLGGLHDLHSPVPARGRATALEEDWPLAFWWPN